jgi:hypothetical protein
MLRHAVTPLADDHIQLRLLRIVHANWTEVQDLARS